MKLLPKPVSAWWWFALLLLVLHMVLFTIIHYYWICTWPYCSKAMRTSLINLAGFKVSLL